MCDQCTIVYRQYSTLFDMRLQPKTGRYLRKNRKLVSLFNQLFFCLKRLLVFRFGVTHIHNFFHAQSFSLHAPNCIQFTQSYQFAICSPSPKYFIVCCYYTCNFLHKNIAIYIGRCITSSFTKTSFVYKIYG